MSPFYPPGNAFFAFPGIFWLPLGEAVAAPLFRTGSREIFLILS